MFKYAVLIFSLIISFNTDASKILVDNVIVNFDENKRTKEDVFIRNISDQKSFVKIVVTEILNAGSPEQSKIEHKNPKKSGIIVNPNRLVLDPQGTPNDHQAIRIVNMNKKLEEDRVYRIQVIPVISDFDKEDEGLGVKILMGYEVLTLVQPNSPVMEYDYKLVNNQLTFNNKGNSNILLHKGEQCDSNKENCKDVKTKRIYGNSSYTFDLPYKDNPVTFYMKFGERNQLKTFE